MSDQSSCQTHAVRAGVESDTQHGAVMPPLHLSASFTFEGFDQPRNYDYTRTANPTRDALADALTELESGAGTVVTSSGMSAITLVCQLLEPCDLLIAPHDCYGGSFRLFSRLAARGQFQVAFVNQTDPVALGEAMRRGPRMIWVETPSNPLLRIVDLEQVAAAARKHSALMVVDNTFLSPALQQPITLGADLVVHSTTKYLNGHSDIVGGAVIARSIELHQSLCGWANCLGLTGAPFDSYLTLRGLRTLHVRLQQHERNAGVLASALSAHPAVTRVYYPGLPEHPGHAVAARQQRGFGGMLSFELAAGAAGVQAFAESLRYFSLAESLGGVESLVCHPATMTHAPMDADARRAAGIGDSLVRLSVGIESTEDLVGDVVGALDRVHAGNFGDQKVVQLAR